MRRGGILPLLLLAQGCGLPLLMGGGPCTLDGPVAALPGELRESSGLVAAGRFGAPGLWSHNDSGWEPVLFRLGAEGGLEGTVEVTGARNVDWEAMAAGPCPEGRCLYIADTGDNLLRRSDLAIYRVPEPAGGVRATAPAVRFPLRLPDGPRDIEAMTLLSDGRALLVSKGWRTPVEVFRTPQSLTAEGWDEPLTLEKVQTFEGEGRLPRMVTGAGSTAAGDLLALRTYEWLRFFRVAEDGRVDAVPGGWANLRPLREPQGEAVAFLPGNRIALTSEAGPGGEVGQLSLLSCRIPGHAW
ncbi:MAG: hypothetical protein WD960_16275 [Gemmatimonadota bacterium]